jgi:hypothetical protein
MHRKNIALEPICLRRPAPGQQNGSLERILPVRLEKDIGRFFRSHFIKRLDMYDSGAVKVKVKVKVEARHRSCEVKSLYRIASIISRNGVQIEGIRISNGLG